MKIVWPQLLQHPQSYILLTTTLTGYLSLIIWQGPRPIVWLSGGTVAAAMLSTWAYGFRQPDPAPTSTDPLSPPYLNQQLQTWEATLPNPSDAGWCKAKQWAINSQRCAIRIMNRAPSLHISLLETLHTVLDLTQQIAESTHALQNIQTAHHKKLAQQRLKASRDRLQTTHQQLQQLQDQLILAALTPDESIPALPERLQTLIDINQKILQSTSTQAFPP